MKFRNWLMTIVISIFVVSCTMELAYGYSGAGGVWAYRYSQFILVNKPGTQTGIQEALDFVASGGGGIVTLGPGTFTYSNTFSVHGNTTVQGQGIGITILKRASGSLSGSNPIYSGNCFTSTFVGQNGTLNESLGLSNITISNMTIDGSQSLFSGVNPGTPNHMGIRFRFVDKVLIENVEIKEMLQDGILLTSCKRGIVNKCIIRKVGQYVSASSRNGIDFLANDSTGLSQGYNSDFVVSNCVVDSTNDCAFHLGNTSNVTYTNNIVLGDHSQTFEFESYDFFPKTIKNVTISNIVARGGRSEFLDFGAFANSISYENILVTNCTATFGATQGTHALRFIRDVNVIMKNISVIGCTFNNINQANTNSFPFVKFNSTSTDTSRNITIKDCTFEGGVIGSALTGIHGLDFSGNMKGVTIENNVFKNVPGLGITFTPKNNSQLASDIRIIGNKIYNANNDAILITPNTGSGSSVRNISVIGNYIEDGALTTGSRAIQIGSLVSGLVVSQGIIKDNICVKRLSPNMTGGIRIRGTAGGTTDSIVVMNNTFIGISSPYFVDASGVTNLYRTDTFNPVINSALTTQYINGSFLYCSDCTKATPCAGGGTGAFAYRINNAWDCNP